MATRLGTTVELIGTKFNGDEQSRCGPAIRQRATGDGRAAKSYFSSWVDTKRRTADLVDVGLRKLMREARDGDHRWPLLLSGETGSGKTCAALAYWDWLGGCYATMGDLHRWVVKIRTNGGRVDLGEDRSWWVDEARFWWIWAGENLCIIDEIGLRGTTSDVEYETLHTAMEKRCGQPLVLVTNLTLGGLGQVYDDRIVSRLAAGTVAVTEGDRRAGGASADENARTAATRRSQGQDAARGVGMH